MIPVGLRISFSHVFGFVGMLKTTARLSSNDQWSFRADYSMGYRSPSIKESFFNWDHLGMFQIKGSKYLQPRKNSYMSIGAECTNDRLFLSGTAYGNYFKDKTEGVWRIYDMQYNFRYTNLSKQRLLSLEALGRQRTFDFLTLNATYSFVDVSKLKGIQANTTSPHAAAASLGYKYNRKNYRLGVIFSASFMDNKKLDVQDRVWVEEKNTSKDVYSHCDLPAYVPYNLSVSQIFYNKVKVTLGVGNPLNCKLKTLGSGVTIFNVSTTPGARGHVQIEFTINDVINALKKKK